MSLSAPWTRVCNAVMDRVCSAVRAVAYFTPFREGDMHGVIHWENCHNLPDGDVGAGSGMEQESGKRELKAETC